MGRTDSRARSLFLLIVFAIVGAALLARLAYWQVGERDRLATAALQQTTVRVPSPSRRGDIFDRSGVVVLATTIDRERLVGTPSEITPARRAEVAAAIVSLLGLQGDDAAQLTQRETSDKKYIILAHALDTQTAARIRAAIDDGQITAVALEPEPVRVYPQPGGGPNTTLAAKVLGFVNREGGGQYGVEQFYQDQLAGRPKVVQARSDVASRTIPDTAVVEDPGAPGNIQRDTNDQREHEADRQHL